MFKKNILLAFTVVCANASDSMGNNDDNQQDAILPKLTSDISVRQDQQNEKNSVSSSVAAKRSIFENTSTKTDQNTKKPYVSAAVKANSGSVAAIRSIFEITSTKTDQNTTKPYVSAAVKANSGSVAAKKNMFENNESEETQQNNPSQRLIELEKQALQTKANAAIEEFTANETAKRDSIYQSQQEEINQIPENDAITTLKNNLTYLADLFYEHFYKKKEYNNNNINAINTLLVLNDKNGDTDARKKRLKTLEEEGKTIDAGLEYANSLKNITALSRDKCIDLSKKYLSTLKEMLQTIEKNIDFYSRTEENKRLFAKELPKEIANRDQLCLLISAAKRLVNE